MDQRTFVVYFSDENLYTHTLKNVTEVEVVITNTPIGHYKKIDIAFEDVSKVESVDEYCGVNSSLIDFLAPRGEVWFYGSYKTNEDIKLKSSFILQSLITETFLNFIERRTGLNMEKYKSSNIEVSGTPQIPEDPEKPQIQRYSVNVPERLYDIYKHFQDIPDVDISILTSPVPIVEGKVDILVRDISNMTSLEKDLTHRKNSNESNFRKVIVYCDGSPPHEVLHGYSYVSSRKNLINLILDRVEEWSNVNLDKYKLDLRRPKYTVRVPHYLLQDFQRHLKCVSEIQFVLCDQITPDCDLAFVDQDSLSKAFENNGLMPNDVFLFTNDRNYPGGGLHILDIEEFVNITLKRAKLKHISDIDCNFPLDKYIVPKIPVDEKLSGTIPGISPQEKLPKDTPEKFDLHRYFSDTMSKDIKDKYRK